MATHLVKHSQKKTFVDQKPDGIQKKTQNHAGRIYLKSAIEYLE